MYKVEKDAVKKLIKVELSGFITLDEAKAFISELESVVKQFKPKEAVLLANMAGYKPASQDVAPILQKLQAISTQNCSKVASVVESVLVQMQGKRLADEVGANTVIMRFKTEDEPMKYLLE